MNTNGTHFGALEIESLNLSDIDVSALDARLEMTNIIPNSIICIENCSSNGTCTVFCGTNIDGCNCNVFT
jgi:hypothetical protein